jgi:hypothetical protein
VAGPRKKNGKSQRFSVRISSLEGLLVNRGEFTLIFPRSRGEAVSYAVSEGAFAGCIDGCRRVKDSMSGPKTTIKNDGSTGTRRCRSRFAFYIFCSRGLCRCRGGRILMRFKGLFWRGKVTGA